MAVLEWQKSNVGKAETLDENVDATKHKYDL